MPGEPDAHDLEQQARPAVVYRLAHDVQVGDDGRQDARAGLEEDLVEQCVEVVGPGGGQHRRQAVALAAARLDQHGVQNFRAPRHRVFDGVAWHAGPAQFRRPAG